MQFIRTRFFQSFKTMLLAWKSYFIKEVYVLQLRVKKFPTPLSAVFTKIIFFPFPLASSHYWHLLEQFQVQVYFWRGCFPRKNHFNGFPYCLPVLRLIFPFFAVSILFLLRKILSSLNLFCFFDECWAFLKLSEGIIWLFP